MTAVTIHPANTSQRLAHQLDEMKVRAQQAMEHAVAFTAHEMAGIAPGRLGRNIAQHVTTATGAINGSLFPKDDWWRYVDEGTGLYVTHHHPITPKASRLVANPRAALKFADGRVRRSSRGQRGQHFVQRTKDRTAEPVARILEQPALDVTAELAHA